jgi:hypothetical protein
VEVPTGRQQLRHPPEQHLLHRPRADRVRLNDPVRIGRQVDRMAGDGERRRRSLGRSHGAITGRRPRLVALPLNFVRGFRFRCEHCAVAPRAFCTVERHVGPLHQIVSNKPFGNGQTSNPQAESDYAGRCFSMRQFQRPDLLLDSSGDFQTLRYVRIWQQNDELLTAISCNQVSCPPCRPSQCAGEGLQATITGLVTVNVIEMLAVDHFREVNRRKRRQGKCVRFPSSFRCARASE